MKYLLLFIAFCAFSLLYSCGKCTCKDPIIKGIDLVNLDTATEKTTTIDVYEKSTIGFTSLVSTHANQPIVPINGHGDLEFSFDYNHDYIVTINPLGKVLKIKNLAHGSVSEQNMGMKSSCHACLNSITYTVNDSVVNRPKLVVPVVNQDFYLGVNQ